MPLNREIPRLPHRAWQTFALKAPVRTHFRPASCAEAGCTNHERGFKIILDLSSMDGQRREHLIRTTMPRRRFLVLPREDGLTEYHFPAGQECYTPHRVFLDREPFCGFRLGDWRTPVRMRQPVWLRGAEWLDRFAAHQETKAEEVRRG